MTRRRHMRARSGGVRCTECGAHAAADGKGTPITLRHELGCPVVGLARWSVAAGMFPGLYRPPVWRDWRDHLSGRLG